MVYRAIGIMSGSSLDGLDLVMAELFEHGGNWDFNILAADCYPYDEDWKRRLESAVDLNARDYQLLHAAYGNYTGAGLIGSHGHTTFHIPSQKMTAQLGDGAAIAAITGLPVVSDLRALDVAFGGQGAPIVPIGEQLLFPGYSIFLNLGGIANISFNLRDNYIAFDVCPANRVLNLLAAKAGKEYDENGNMAAAGKLDQDLLEQLNSLDYYQQSPPKSLANQFGTETVFPMVINSGLELNDAIHTYVKHIVQQVKKQAEVQANALKDQKMLVTGGGAFNTFLIDNLRSELSSIGIEVVVPEENIVKYKEALVMALIGVLRWRQEYNVLSSVTGAQRNSIGGAVWIGQEA